MLESDKFYQVLHKGLRLLTSAFSRHPTRETRNISPTSTTSFMGIPVPTFLHVFENLGQKIISANPGTINIVWWSNKIYKPVSSFVLNWMPKCSDRSNLLWRSAHLRDIFHHVSSTTNNLRLS